MTVYNDFTPTDLGKCGESLVFEQVCGKSNGVLASGVLGVGLIGEVNPSQDRSGLEVLDFGVRLEGRWDRFTFSISDYWGWDDGFYVEKVQTFSRRVDPTTGAPVNVFGALDCKIRTDASGTPVGPDNIPGNFDDQTPSVGNCLLYDNPSDPNDVQRLRAAEDVSLNHYANQTMFALLCSVTFDADTGQCLLDRPNDATLFPVIASSLAGQQGFVSTPVEGAQLIRKAPGRGQSPTQQVLTRYQQVGTNPATGVARDVFVEDVFGQLRPRPGFPANIGSALDPNQQALLGCGPRFATGCDDSNGASVGGIDFLNTDASVQLQEFTILKWAQGNRAGDPNARDALGVPLGSNDGALVGSRNRAFEPGISNNGTDFATAIRNGAGASFIAERTDPNTGIFDPNNPIVPTDFQIEGMKWPADPFWLERDILVFLDPMDPDTPINPLGQDCTSVFMGPDPGCTNLEILSANVERIVIGVEIIGNDRAFDPPETFAEMLAMLDTNVDTEIGFDPVSGTDGIRFADFDLDQNGRIEDGNLAVDQKGIFARDNNLVTNSWADCVRAAGTTAPSCYRPLLGPVPGGSTLAPASGILVGALPLGIRMRIRPEGQQGFTKELVEVQQLTPIELQDLAAEKVIKVDATKLGYGGAFRATDVNGDGTAELTLRIDNFTATNQEVDLFSYDIDGNGTRDLDEDEDETFDFVDDGTPGPISDDNILCGSGIPGDVLQDALQYEFDAEQEALLAAAGGLPPRSPVFCAGLVGLINTTAFTRKDLRAGGDTRYGRRDFLWHGGEQLALNYQRKNVFGFGVDFAEDRSKTSWGLEFSWMSDRLYNNNLRSDGISRSDEYVLSISVDRPTFFNFLNPNRSFFINLQVFMRWIPDWQGSSDSKDGMYTVQSNEFAPGFVTLTMLTGYFQDRLNPRVTAVWDPDSSTYGLLAGVGYRWNDAFSTSFAVNHFFGAQKQAQVGLFPPVQNTYPDLTSAMFRGTAAVRNRDVAQLIVRYTF